MGQSGPKWAKVGQSGPKWAKVLVNLPCVFILEHSTRAARHIGCGLRAIGVNIIMRSRSVGVDGGAGGDCPPPPRLKPGPSLVETWGGGHIFPFPFFRGKKIKIKNKMPNHNRIRWYCAIIITWVSGCARYVFQIVYNFFSGKSTKGSVPGGSKVAASTSAPKKWTKQDDAARKIQTAVRKLLARRAVEKKRKDKEEYEATIERLEREVIN